MIPVHWLVCAGVDGRSTATVFLWYLDGHTHIDKGLYYVSIIMIPYWRWNDDSQRKDFRPWHNLVPLTYMSSDHNPECLLL